MTLGTMCGIGDDHVELGMVCGVENHVWQWGARVALGMTHGVGDHVALGMTYGIGDHTRHWGPRGGHGGYLPSGMGCRWSM